MDESLYPLPAFVALALSTCESCIARRPAGRDGYLVLRRIGYHQEGAPNYAYRLIIIDQKLEMSSTYDATHARIHELLKPDGLDMGSYIWYPLEWVATPWNWFSFLLKHPPREH